MVCGERRDGMKYRKKPVEIEAYQTDREMVIRTLEGEMRASAGDYIITGVNGEQYPCKPDIFAKTYEPASDETERGKSGYLLPCVPGDTVYLAVELPCGECALQDCCARRDGRDDAGEPCPLMSIDVEVETVELCRDEKGAMAFVINDDYVCPMELAWKMVHRTRAAAMATLREFERSERK